MILYYLEAAGEFLSKIKQAFILKEHKSQEDHKQQKTKQINYNKKGLLEKYIFTECVVCELIVNMRYNTKNYVQWEVITKVPE